MMDRSEARSLPAEIEEPPTGEATDDRNAVDASPWRDRLPSNVIALAIATREHEVVTELPPLFASVDSDALDAYLRSSPEATATFVHCGYEVTVTGGGEVELTRLERR